MRSFAFTLCAALTLASGSAYADPPASPEMPSVLAASVLAKGTIVRLRIETDLEAGRSKPGDPVQFTVDRDVYGPDHVLLLTRGMAATGKVTASTEHDRFGRRGQLTFVCDTVRAANGVQVPVNLVVGSGSGAAADAADELDAQEFYSFRLQPLDPDGYVQSESSDGHYIQPQGLEQTEIYDPGRLFSGGAKVTARRGQTYTAHIANSISIPVAQRY